MRKLQLLIYPIQIRSGIGYGKIKYDIDSWSSPAFDGEAYYFARDAINAIPKEVGNIVFFNTNSKFDKYLNTFCMSNVSLRMRQNAVCRWIELLADIIYPIKEMEETPEIYSFILEHRESIDENRHYIRDPYPDIKKTSIDVLFKGAKETFKRPESKEQTSQKGQIMFIENFWAYGMGTILAQAMQASRQNIARYILLGRIKQSRSMDKAIYDLLGEVKND